MKRAAIHLYKRSAEWWVCYGPIYVGTGRTWREAYTNYLNWLRIASFNVQLQSEVTKDSGNCSLLDLAADVICNL